MTAIVKLSTDLQGEIVYVYLVEYKEIVHQTWFISVKKFSITL